MKRIKIYPRATLSAVLVITLVLVGLKIFGHIDWPWWHVTVPLWGLYLVLTLYVITIVLMANRR